MARNVLNTALLQCLMNPVFGIGSLFPVETCLTGYSLVAQKQRFLALIELHNDTNNHVVVGTNQDS
jgi:hypothetical protein